jgi:hypothetical protein
MQNVSRPKARPLRPCRLFAAVLLAGVLLAPPASAFTIEGGEVGGGSSWAPKFDLEEQSRQFRNPNSNALPGAYGVDVPGGQLQFGVQRGPSAFGSPFGFESGSRANRQHFDRMFDPSYQFNSR